MIVAMHCYDGGKNKLGGGPQKVEGFLLCMTILWRYIELHMGQ